MSHSNPPESVIEDLLQSARTIAVVGASSKPDRPSNGIFRYLLQAGYRVIPVNPHETEVHGQNAYPNLGSIPVPVDIVDVFRRADKTPVVAKSAVEIDARILWLQLGVINEDAAAIAERAGMTVVMDRCIGVEHSRLRISRAGQGPEPG